MAMVVIVKVEIAVVSWTYLDALVFALFLHSKLRRATGQINCMGELQDQPQRQFRMSWTNAVILFLRQFGTSAGYLCSEIHSC